MSDKRTRGIPEGRLGRVVWLTAAILFLSFVAVSIWLWAHSNATRVPRSSTSNGGVESPINEVDTDAPLVDGVPAVADPTCSDSAWYPSPFRPQEETDNTKKETDKEEEIETDTEPTTEEELIYHARPNDRMEIALSFDDGPHPRYTPIILDILAEYGIKATFFMVGENVRYYSAAAEAVVAAGHEIGNHTFTHRKINLMNEHEILQEIESCEEAVASVSEQKLHFIRPPEGHLNDTMRRVIGSLDYQIVLWDVDTRDWAHTPPATITKHVLDTVQAGDIILMHDFIGYNSPTPEALRMLIPALLERGYHFVTVGELVNGVE